MVAVQQTTIDSGHTAWILVSMALVQLMLPGLAFFYAGLLRPNSVIAMMMQNFAAMGLITVMWFLFVFSLCFGHTYYFFGSITTFGAFNNVDGLPLFRNTINGTHDGGTVVGDIPGLVFAGYQGMFACITPALMTGAFADRLRFAPYLVFIGLWIIVVYAPFCHWVWGGGWMGTWGVWDFAGGIVVHTTAGFSALAAVHVLGSREKIEGAKVDEQPHNIPFVALGTALLWFGWFGFNGGSALASTGGAAFAAVNSEIAASTALSVWVAIEWVRNGKPSLVGLCVGAIAGLATITPCAGFVRPWGAFIVGIAAAVFCYACCELKNRAGWDDALDVWGVHGMGGALGSILVGVLSDPTVTGGDPAWSGPQLGKQVVATLIAAVYSYIVSVVLLKLIGLVMRLKPTKEEMADIDKAWHGELAYTGTPGNSFYATGQGAAAAAAGGVAPGPGKAAESTTKDVTIEVNK
jgi:Amt family ammonium transporter